MKANLIRALQKYLDKQDLHASKTVTLVADHKGEIISLAGFTRDIGIVKPIVGARLSDFHPVFVGLFPIKAQLVLPNIETHPGVYWNIHFLPVKEACWIIFEERSEVIEQLKPGLQKRNEAKFESERREITISSTAEKALSLLDYLLFQANNDGAWETIGRKPEWAADYFPKNQTLYYSEDIISIFPFIEILMQEDNNADVTDALSGIWTEPGDNEEYYFRAGLLETIDPRLLYIKKLHPQFEANREILQLARNKELESENLTRSAQLATAMNRTKEQFLLIISHDLRSPFISIISALDFLFEDRSFTGGINEEQRELLDYIYEDSKRLLDYLEKLLDMTRLDTGKLKPVIQVVDLNNLWKLTEAQFDTRLREKDITLIVQIKEGFKLDADPTLFSQVINNLLSNAIKFTPQGGKIWFTAHTTNSKSEIRLKDSGVGIPQEKIDTLFKSHEKYYTYGTEGEKGSGLGLSITKKILDAHNYTIQCKSEQEKGTEFIIRL